jgi:hypothetical protein
MYQLHEDIKERWEHFHCFPEETHQNKIITGNSQLKQLMAAIVKHVITSRSTGPERMGDRVDVIDRTTETL